MAEQTGHSVAAIQARQAALARRHSAVSDVDQLLTDALTSAHAATVEGVSRLDAIAREIDGAVANQAAFAIDTPSGRREFHHFLVAKQREIVAAITDARELARAKTVVLKELQLRYTDPLEESDQS